MDCDLGLPWATHVHCPTQGALPYPSCEPSLGLRARVFLPVPSTGPGGSSPGTTAFLNMVVNLLDGLWCW